MISEKLQKAINEQITAEMWSSNLYLAMSFYFEKEGFSGFAHWMKKQSQEEMGHAYAMADYIIKRILVLQFLRDASVLEYVQCKSVYGRPLGIRQPERVQEFLDGGLAHYHRAISDRHVRRRDVQCRPVILERLGNHYRLDFSGSLDRRDRSVNRKMEKINKKEGCAKN